MENRIHTIESVSSVSITETEYISFLVDFAVENNFSVAVWRLPNDATKHLIIAQQHELLKRDAAIEELTSGFIFAPFDRMKDSVYLPAHYSFSFVDGKLKAPESPLEISSQRWLDEQISVQTIPSTVRIHRSSVQLQDHSKEHYTSLVQKGIQEIGRGVLEKVVLSHTKIFKLPASFDVVDSFQKLCSTYPNALVSFVSSPDIGSWLGASPEVLVSIEDKSIFKTVALAGTQPYHDGLNLKSVAWTQKEIEEQALVERYIISCFKKIRLREYDEHGPKTVVAGNLMHLKSDFTVDMKATNFPQLGSVMLQLLHPTSAVCGMPLENAMNFLKKNEGYDRQFYSGFLGPVNINDNINIFVNLRCMQLTELHAILYAGAGVTIDSVPEDEWKETEVKLNTLLNVIA